MSIFNIISMTMKVISRNLKRMYLYFFGTWAVHCEVLYDDGIWAKAKNLSGRKRLIWYCITPANYNLMKASGNLSLSKGEYSKLLKKRYRELESMGQTIQLHVHLSILDNMPKERQRKIIKEACKWMIDNGFRVTEFVPGWWDYNNDTLDILKETGLKMVAKDRYYEIHDYELGPLNRHLGV